MKKYIYTILALFSLLLSSCIITADPDDYEDDEYSYYYSYLTDGRWYPEYPNGMTDCDYNSYTIYRGRRMYMYDCSGYEFDSGTYDIHGDWLYVHFENGDRARYEIIRARNGELVLENVASGERFYYVRR